MKHTVLIWTAIASSLIFSVACNKGSNEESQDGDTAGESSDWTATAQVKTRTIELQNSPEGVLYQDFTFQYKLSYPFHGTKPVLYPFKRKGSSFSTETWAEEYGFGGWGWINYEHAGIVTLGPVAGLSSITSKEINVSGKMNGNKYQADPRFSTYSVNYYGEDFVPNSGYYLSFASDLSRQL